MLNNKSIFQITAETAGNNFVLKKYISLIDNLIEIDKIFEWVLNII